MAALAPSPAFALVAPQKHGLNGLHVPIDRSINLTMRVLDGPDWELQSLRGNVVFMNFFATWCPPCMEETPALVEYAARNIAGVKFVGVDVGEGDDTVRRWRKKYGITYTIGMDQKSIFFVNIGMKGYPTTLVFRPSGQLSCAFFGGIDADELEVERQYALSSG